MSRVRRRSIISRASEHPSITYIGMAAANLSLAYLLTEQDHYLQEAKRWIFTAVDYDVWGYGFLVDVDLKCVVVAVRFGAVLRLDKRSLNR